MPRGSRTSLATTVDQLPDLSTFGGRHRVQVTNPARDTTPFTPTTPRLLPDEAVRHQLIRYPSYRALTGCRRIEVGGSLVSHDGAELSAGLLHPREDGRRAQSPARLVLREHPRYPHTPAWRPGRPRSSQGGHCDPVTGRSLRLCHREVTAALAQGGHCGPVTGRSLRLCHREVTATMAQRGHCGRAGTGRGMQGTASPSCADDCGWLKQCGETARNETVCLQTAIIHNTCRECQEPKSGEFDTKLYCPKKK